MRRRRVFHLPTAIDRSTRDSLEPPGIIRLDIPFRDISRPPFISRSLVSKKERGQEHEKACPPGFSKEFA